MNAASVETDYSDNSRTEVDDAAVVERDLLHVDMIHLDSFTLPQLEIIGIVIDQVWALPYIAVFRISLFSRTQTC